MSETKRDIVELMNRVVHDDSALNSIREAEFVGLVAYVFELLGYSSTIAHGPSERGYDILLRTTDPLGRVTQVAVECKHHSSGVRTGIQVVRQAEAILASDETLDSFLVVAGARFTPEAREVLHRSSRIQLIDRQQLVSLIQRSRRTEGEHAQALAYRLGNLPVSREFGRLVLPEGVEAPESRIILPRLQLPAEYAHRVAAVERVPIDVLRAVANDSRTMLALTPRNFEEFIAELVDRLGFRDVILTPRSGDGGRDVIASRSVHGIPITFFFECKKYAEGNLVQLDTLRSLLGVVAHHGAAANIGVLVTTSRFTRGCKELIANECRLDGKDYDGVVGWVQEYEATYPRTEQITG